MPEQQLNQKAADPKVSDTPEVAEVLGSTLKERLGIRSSDIQSSHSLKVVQTVSTAMKRATEAIQENSAILANVVTKEQRNMFASFLKQLRIDTRSGEEQFVRNQEKFLTKIAALQVSLTESLKNKPDDKNIPALLQAIGEIKNSLVTQSKGGLWQEIKGQLFTMPKAEHFREDSFIRRAFFNGNGLYERKIKKAQRMQQVSNALGGIEEPLGLHFDTERDKYTAAKDPLSTFKPTGKNFRRNINTFAPPTPAEPNTVQAASFEPNKKILEDSVAALVALGKHDRKRARADAIEAMKKGAASVQDVLREVLAEGNKPEPPAITPVPVMEPISSVITPDARIRYADVREEHESPYADTDPNVLPEESTINPLDYHPGNQNIGRPQKRQRLLGSRRGGLAGPELFRVGNVTPSIGPEEPIEETETPLIQKQDNKVETLLEKADDTLEEIADSLVQLIHKENGGVLSNVVSGGMGAGLGGALAGAGAGAGVGAGEAATAATAGSVAAPVMVGLGGLAGGFLLGEGINKMLGQQTATNAMLESHRISQLNERNVRENQDRVLAHGYSDFASWHRANVAHANRVHAADLTRMNAEAQPQTVMPQPAPVVVQVPTPAPASPIYEPASPGGVRPTDPVFLRYQDKRWVR